MARRKRIDLLRKLGSVPASAIDYLDGRGIAPSEAARLRALAETLVCSEVTLRNSQVYALECRMRFNRYVEFLQDHDATKRENWPGV